MYASLATTKSWPGTPFPPEDEGQAWGGREVLGGLLRAFTPERVCAWRVPRCPAEEDADRKSDTWICQLVYFRFFLKVNVMSNQSSGEEETKG